MAALEQDLDHLFIFIHTEDPAPPSSHWIQPKTLTPVLNSHSSLCFLSFLSFLIPFCHWLSSSLLSLLHKQMVEVSNAHLHVLQASFQLTISDYRAMALKYQFGHSPSLIFVKVPLQMKVFKSPMSRPSTPRPGIFPHFSPSHLQPELESLYPQLLSQNSVCPSSPHPTATPQHTYQSISFLKKKLSDFSFQNVLLSFQGL